MNFDYFLHGCDYNPEQWLAWPDIPFTTNFHPGGSVDLVFLMNFNPTPETITLPVGGAITLEPFGCHFLK